MIRQLVAFALSGALMISSTAGFAAAYPQPAQNQHHQNPHHYQKQSVHHHGMYEQGRQQGWYKKGGHLPKTYRGQQYVVTNWRGQHLRPPPRGYHWVRSNNGDFLLVAITTGVIASIIAAVSQH